MAADDEKDDGTDAPAQVEQSDTKDDAAPPEEAGAGEQAEAVAPSGAEEREGALEKSVAPATKPTGAAWANSLVRVEHVFTWVESRVLFVALMALVFALVFWISLRGMASPIESKSSAGIVFRMLVGAGILGGISRVAAVRYLKLDEVKSALLTIGGVVLGVLIAPVWRTVGIERADAILNWLQEGSSLTLVGGLRGVSTRLTVLVALIGASLAAARSKHINIDVVLRFMRPSLRVPVHLLGAVATVTVCFVAAYGFFDYTSSQGFGQDSDATMAQKFAGVRNISEKHRFVFYKQIGLDFRTMPDVVFSGVRWDAPTRLNGKQWNTWLDEAGFSEEFTAEEVALMKAPVAMENEPRVPIVTLPGEAAKGALEHDLNLLWPLGLFWMGVRVILRALLVLSGHASVEPDADEPDKDDAPAAEAAR